MSAPRRRAVAACTWRGPGVYSVVSGRQRVRCAARGRSPHAQPATHHPNCRCHWALSPSVSIGLRCRAASNHTLALSSHSNVLRANGTTATAVFPTGGGTIHSAHGTTGFLPSPTLKSRSYIGLVLSQFLAAFNDQASHIVAFFYATDMLVRFVGLPHVDTKADCRSSRPASSCRSFCSRRWPA